MDAMNAVKSKLLLVPALALGLAGCVSLGTDAPDSLLTLTPDASAPAGSGNSGKIGGALAIVTPEAPAKIDKLRVPVQVNDSEVAYLKDAVWVEKPAQLFRQLLAERIRAQTGMLVIDGDDPALGSDTKLFGTLREFGYDARSMNAVVRYDAIRNGPNGTMQTRRFEAEVPTLAPKAGPVGIALNEAANDVAGQVAEWLGES
jgi:cholesterol transport system auxiliary component